MPNKEHVNDMKNCMLYPLFVWISLATLPSVVGAGDVRDDVARAVEAVLQQIPKDVSEEVRSKPELTLSARLGKPGAMQIRNALKINSIPEWGLNTKELTAECVLALANSELKGGTFDLLGHLESTAAAFDLSANPPYEYHPHKLPPTYRITHVVFQVSLEGEISALYVATDFQAETILVNPLAGSWRKPSPLEHTRILVDRRAVQIGVPSE